MVAHFFYWTTPNYDLMFLTSQNGFGEDFFRPVVSPLKEIIYPYANKND